MKVQLSSNQKKTLARAQAALRKAVMSIPPRLAVTLQKGFLSGVRSEREQNARIIEQSQIGTSVQRKALADLIRLGHEPVANKLELH